MALNTHGHCLKKDAWTGELKILKINTIHTLMYTY